MLLSRLKKFCFMIDPRTLGLFRIIFALLLIHDWFTRWPNLEAFYTSFGVLPPQAPLWNSAGDFHFSILDSATSLAMVKLLFFLGLLCYLFFLIGWRTKLFQILGFVFFVSVINRNIMIRDGSDLVMVAMFFWSLFLPLGITFSLDRLKKRMQQVSLSSSVPSPEDSSTLSIGAFAIVAQLALVYLWTGISKSGENWRNGTALYYALHFTHFMTPFGKLLLQQPLWVLKGMNWFTLAVEYLAFPLIFLPVLQPFLRRLCILLLGLLQAGIGVFMDVGHFPWVMIGLTSLLLMEEDWKLITRFFLRWSRPAVVYYDDTCGFCTLCCRALALADAAGKLTWIGTGNRSLFQHSLSDEELKESLITFDRTSGLKKIKSEAFAQIFQALPLPFHLFRLIALPGVRFASDMLYDFIAKNRHKLSLGLGLQACGITDGEKPTVSDARPIPPYKAFAARFGRIFLNLAVALLFIEAVVEGYNTNVVSATGWMEIPESVPAYSVFRVIQLIEDWHMFSPDPAQDTGWWVVDGETESGERFDPLTGKTPNFDQPPNLPKVLDRFWRKYLYRIWQRDYSNQRLYFGQYLTRKNHRDKPAGQRLVRFDFYYVVQRTLPYAAKEPFPAKPILLWRHECFEKR